MKRSRFPVRSSQLRDTAAWIGWIPRLVAPFEDENDDDYEV
jgi:hypothetical protein